MSSIFEDGNIVHTLTMPAAVVRNAFERKQWAMDALAAYVKVKHGVGSLNVERSRSHNGKVTGTQISFLLSSKEITYMLVEPNGSRGEVHVVKKEVNFAGVNVFDVVDTVYSLSAKAKEGFRSNPFAALGSLKIAR